MPNASSVMESFCGEEFRVFDSNAPAFSGCFEMIVFMLLPFSLLAASSSYYIGLLKIPDLRLRTPRRYLFRQICTLVTLILTVANHLITIFARHEGHGFIVISFALSTIALLAHFIFLTRLAKVHFLYERGPRLVMLFWLLTLPHFIANAEYFSAILNVSNSASYLLKIQVGLTVLAAISQLLYLFCITVPYAKFRTVSIVESEPSLPEEREQLLDSSSGSYYQLSDQSREQLDRNQCPADTANIFSKIFFCWVNSLMKTGAKRQLLNVDSVYELPEDITTTTLHNIFSKNLDAVCLEQSSENTIIKYALLRVLNKSFGLVYYASGIMKFLSDALAFAGPLLLNKLVNYIENADEPLVHGYYYATALFLSTFVGSLLSAHFDYQVNKVNLRVKSSLITNIYNKTMRAQPSELSSYTTGEITNFMSTDVNRVVNFCVSFHQFWSLPFQVAVTLYLLYLQVGIVFLAGVGLAVVMIFFNRYLANQIGKYNAAMMKEKDSRVKLMTEILLGIRVVKFNAWENIMSEKLGRIRDEELKNLKGIKYFDAGCVYLWATTPVLISLLTFSIYSAIGHELTAAKVFTVIALINMLISPLNAFPWVINGLMEAWISLERLNKFIQLQNLELEKYYDFPETVEPDDIDIVVDIKKANFSWNSSLPNYSEETNLAVNGEDQGLTDISLQIREGQFIGVIGSVGSGKSSLLSAILAEMKKENGKLYVDCVNEGFAIVHQEPWIQHASIRNNILWGRPYNAHHYQSVVDACALTEDLQIFPDRDLTEVGENGVTLSGGQKARVALARAMYQDKSLYLLDDPISAVDQHVASYLYDRCIMGELVGKTRILCTHHTRYLRHADKIIVMKNGRINQIGTPDEILQLSPITNNKKLLGSKSKLSVASSFSNDSLSSDVESKTRLMTEEEKAVGTVAFSVYKSYWLAIGSCLAFSILVFLLLMQGSKVMSDWWLSHWVTNMKPNASIDGLHYISQHGAGNLYFTSLHPQFNQPLSISITTYTTFLKGVDFVSSMSSDTKWYLMIYGCIAASNSLFTLFRSFLFAYGGIKAAHVLHSALLKGILQAPVCFFDITPVGRILNRFSSDTYTVDDSLPFILNIFLAQLVGVIGTVVITCYGLPWFAIALAPLGGFYLYIQHYYRLTSRELKRLSSISLSPIYAHFTESLSGLSTIRAFRKQDDFRTKNLDLVTANQRCNFSTLAAQEWFGMRLQMIGVAMVTCVAFVAVIMHQNQSVSPGLAGLALSYALSVTSLLSGVITSFTETEKQMVAVERESYYINNIPKEEDMQTSDVNIMNQWPSGGTVEFSNVSLRYREGLPLALEKISFDIESGEKIGIVGRTGSGKSSLLMLLFGMVDSSEGNIFIDGINTKDVPLQVLRSKLSIIPQDPFLFSGSIRENLVPDLEAEIDDDSLITVLEQCNLKDKVYEMGGLHTNVGERGKRLSVGQRQLLCLARALLKDTKIVCLDEATASVDGESDAMLQKTIKEQFADRTVLTIAHRIETIMDCDRVLVMDDGKVAEFGPPDLLMTNSDSLFCKLARGSNPTNI
ncbi:ATP-binding cassette sub-family C member 10-like [Styela clava]